MKTSTITWHSVKDALPNNAKYVIVYGHFVGSFKSLSAFGYCLRDERGNPCWFHADGVKFYVSHWAELPEPITD